MKYTAILAFLIAATVAIPASAETILWTFDDTTASSMGNAGVKLSDGSTLTGSFDYTCNSGYGGNCDNAGAPGPLGTFSNVNVNVSGGSIIGAGQTWYILQNADDSGSDNQSIFLVNYNPATTPDATAIAGAGNCIAGNPSNACDPGYVIALSISNDPQIISSAAVGMDDSGGVYLLNNGAPPQGGYCVNVECGAVNSSTAPVNFLQYQTTENDPTGHIWASAYVPPPPPTSGTPEPATMALAGSALLALGFVRRKFSAKR